MIGLILALLASAAWGGSDFTGGLLTKSLPLPAVLILSQLAGLAVLVIAVVGAGAQPPSWRILAQALAAGVLGAVELGLLYLAISRGPVIVVAPVAAAGAVIPVIAGAVAGEHVPVAAAAGIGCALFGAVMTAWEPAATATAGKRILGSGTLLAVAAAVAIGGLFVLFNRAAVVSPLWAAAAVRAGGAVSASLLLVSPVVRRQVLAPRPTGTLAAILGLGLLDACGDLCYAFASALGQLAVVAVLASLYPVATVLLAAGLLGERVRARQTTGALLALCGIALLGTAS